MKKFALAIMSLLLFFAVDIGAQRTKKPVSGKTTAPAKKVALLPADYEIRVLVNSIGVFMVSVVPTAITLDAMDKSVSSFLRDNFDVIESGPLNAKREHPKIIVKFDPDTDIGTILNAVNLVRVSDKASVELNAIGEHVAMIVPRKKTEAENLNVKPNPLRLVVEMSDTQKITLNNEEMGKLSDLSPLVKFLGVIFKERLDNGVLRENSYEIEKTVFIKMPPKATGVDLIKIAKALQEAGAEPIGFWIEEPIDEVPSIEAFSPPPAPSKIKTSKMPIFAPKKKKP